MRKIALALVAALGAFVPALAAGAPTPVTTDPAAPSQFSRLFPGLPAVPVVDQNVVSGVALGMFDDQNPTLDNETGDEGEPVTSGYTYFGQFLDHDLTLDPAPQPTAPLDPTTLTNVRTFRLDLDSVYGGGPSASPQLYAADGRHMLVQDPNPNGVIDVPRTPDGTAIIVDPRNDENEIIAQVHAAFLRFHNNIADAHPEWSFAQVRQYVQWTWQYLVVNDFLPADLGQQETNRAFRNNPQTEFNLGDPISTPLEFSVSAFRFGHSQVRNAYELNDTSGLVPVFDGTEGDLHGGRQIPAGRQINWGEFFDVAGNPEFEGNVTRKIDTKLSGSLFNLPIPGAEANGSNNLAFRNIVRAQFYAMPCGQAVARALGVRPILSDAQVALPAQYAGCAPLWFYILRESELRTDGDHVGPTGARIIAGSIAAVLRADSMSYLNRDPGFVPNVAGQVGEFDFGEFLRFAGVPVVLA